MRFIVFSVVVRVEYTYGTPMSVLPSFAERKRVWVFRRCTLSSCCHQLAFCSQWLKNASEGVTALPQTMTGFPYDTFYSFANSRDQQKRHLRRLPRRLQIRFMTDSKQRNENAQLFSRKSLTIAAAFIQPSERTTPPPQQTSSWHGARQRCTYRHSEIP